MRQHRALAVSGFLLDLLGFAAFIGAVAGTAQPFVQGLLAALSFMAIFGGTAMTVRARRLRLQGQLVLVRAQRRR
jgi:hypothetical protein